MEVADKMPDPMLDRLFVDRHTHTLCFISYFLLFPFASSCLSSRESLEG